MAIDITNKALRGSISQILLNALITGDKYGYEICKDIEQKSNGKLLLKQPSLYSSLRRMENQGLITSYWEESDMGGRRHYYSITPKGKAHYEKKQVDWNEFGDLINALPSSSKDEVVQSEQIVACEKSEQASIEKKTKLDIEVIKQEDLFSLSTKKIMPQDEKNNGGETFIQFDMFDQKPSFIKTTTDETGDVFSTFKSKYQEVASHSIEGEDQEADNATNNNLDNEKNSTLLETTEAKDNQSDYKHGYDAVYLSPEETIDNLTKPKENSFSTNEIVFGSGITDNSNKYQKSKLNFETNSFLDKQASERYVPHNNKFAYTSDSDNIYGGDFGEIEKESLRDSLDSFLDTEEDKNLSSVIDTPKGFDDLLDEESSSIQSIEDVLPTPKAFNEYDEVLKDDERIEFPIKNENKPYDKPDEYNPNKYVEPNETGTFIKQLDRESPNYKDKLSTLYSDTSKVNPYNKPLEEEKISLDSEELFESTPITKAKINVESNTLTGLQESFGNEGIKLKIYSKEKYNKKKEKNYVNLNTLTLVQGWLVWLFMALEIIITGVILNANQLLPTNQLTIYYWAFGLSFIYPIIYTIIYFANPYKKISSNFKLSISLFNKFLAMLINIVFIFAVNLFLGMTSLNQLAYLSYWLLPTILTTNYLISTLIYFLLLKSKKFSM